MEVPPVERRVARGNWTFDKVVVELPQGVAIGVDRPCGIEKRHVVDSCEGEPVEVVQVVGKGVVGVGGVEEEKGEVLEGVAVEFDVEFEGLLFQGVEGI